MLMSDRGSSETKLTGLNHPQLSFRVKETERVDGIPDADCRSDTYYSNVGDVFRELAEGIE